MIFTQVIIFTLLVARLAMNVILIMNAIQERKCTPSCDESNDHSLYHIWSVAFALS